MKNHLLSGGLLASAIPVMGAFADAAPGHGSGAFCNEPGMAFLAVQCNLKNCGQGDVGFHIRSNRGEQAFMFASGTSVANIASAIESLASTTGAHAECVRESCDQSGVILRSHLTGDDAFISVQQIAGCTPMVSPSPSAQPTLWEHVDHGADAVPGDVNCDGLVAIGDLLEVVRSWGTCPTPPSPCPADLDQNASVGLTDLLVVVQHWGATD